MNGHSHLNISPLLTSSHLSKPNGFIDYPTTILPNLTPKIPPGISPPSIHTITPPAHVISSTNDTTFIKPLMAEPFTNGTTDAFEEFRRMAAQIHQQFNAPYSKVINAASSPSPPIPTSDGTQNMNNGNDKHSKTLFTTTQNRTPPVGTFMKSWKVEHTAGTTHSTFIKMIIYICFV